MKLKTQNSTGKKEKDPDALFLSFDFCLLS
jgi:hypothetical protein